MILMPHPSAPNGLACIHIGLCLAIDLIMPDLEIGYKTAHLLTAESRT